MTRISKDLAESIAKSLTAKKSSDIETLKKNKTRLVHNAWMKKVPKDVVAMFEKKRGYINTTSYAYLHGKGVHNTYVAFDSRVPTSGGQTSLTMSDKDTEEFVKLQNSIEKKEKALEQLRREITATLMSLRTFKRVRAEFPEAAKYLPAETGVTQALTINIGSILERLKD